MDFLRDWPPFMLLADAAVEVAASREKGLEDAEDKLLKSENPENNKPFAFFDSDDEQPKVLTADDKSMRKEVRVVKLFGTYLFCTEQSEADQQVSCTNWPEAYSKKPDRKRRFGSGESSCSRAKKPRQKDTSGHQQVPDLPETFKEMIKGMEGSDEKLIIQKRLYTTDLSNHHGRLSVPLNKVKAEFLSNEEKMMLEGGSKRGIEASIIEPCLRRSEVSLKRWEMKKQNGKPSSVVYALTRGWNSIVKDNDLKEGHWIQLWSFRANSKLCFALVIVDPSLAEEGR